ncbi:MAG TPA: galactose oxidase-like domain-containing protein [Ramlibacter sp.]|nr:galactose oxidase-like domain-containing protein [Ramlibacter sp.]
MNARRGLTAVLPALLAACCLLSPGAASAQASVTGQWAKLPSLPFSPVHQVFMPNGKVIVWGRDLNRTLYDPVIGAASALPNPGYDQFCAGQSYLGDGRLLVPGGHIADFVGLPNASIYDPATNTWTRIPDMNAGRWYPTVTTLANGDALVVSGQMDTTAGPDTLPQVYEVATNTWRDLTGAQLVQNLYPAMFLAPNGKVVDAGPINFTRALDTSGTGSWTDIGWHVYGWRDGESAVMYAPGKIIEVGGGDPPVPFAEVLDLNVAAPAWRAVASMSVGRRHLNASLLPDGTVFVNGGTSGPGPNNTTTAVFTSELWNPATETWTKMANATVPRLYHSSAFLIPDGRVITFGGDGVPDVEAFSPPYLFKGARPSMSAVPASLGYGQQFTVQSPDAASIRKVTLIRLPAPTHSFDQNARLNELPFTAGTGSLNITTPANGNLAPPGYYMLFILNGNGVPSVGSIVRIAASGTAPPPPPPPPPPAPAPALSSMLPTSATAGGPAFTLTVNGSNFVSGAVVRWNGVPRTTTFVSATRVTAAIAAADIAAAGTANVSVANPDGSLSGVAPFTIAAGTGGGTTCVPYPDWSATTRYMPGDKVTRLGKYYIALPISATVWNLNSAPEWTPSYWALTPCPPTSTTPGTSTFTLTVSKIGTATTTGTITSNPAGISCGAACGATFAGGGTVTLTATAASGGVFAGWGGACTGTGTCTVTMSANNAVTATFNTAPTGTCVPFPQWDATIRYMPGNKVTRLGKFYVALPISATVWNVNSPPEWTPSYWAVTTCP